MQHQRVLGGAVCVAALWGTLPAGLGQSPESLAADPAAAALTPASQSAPALAIRRLQLLTVTDTSAVFTWETTGPADAIVRYGTRSDRLDQTATSTSDPPARFHHCELHDLRPGTRYYYLCESGPAKAGDGLLGPGQFTTLVPPPGRELFSFATMTDMHIGQQVVARLVLRGRVVSPGVRWPGIPFWQLAGGACIRDINASDAAFTIIKGDITDGSSENEFPAARQLLSRLKRPCYVVHGNHDALAPFLRTFALARPWYSFDHEGLHFVVLDTEPLVHEQSPALEPELKWLAHDLREHRQDWTFVFVHRPVLPKLARESGEAVSEELLELGSGILGKLYGSGAPGIINQATGHSPAVAEKNARLLAELLREHGRIAGVFAGHLHRNYVGYWPEQTGNLPYVETASTKEYPSGYAVTRVFRGGYMQNYYVPRDPRCLEWSAMTQDAYARLGYQSKAGTVSERNFVVRWDELNLSPRTAASRAP